MTSPKKIQQSVERAQKKHPQTQNEEIALEEARRFEQILHCNPHITRDESGEYTPIVVQEERQSFTFTCSTTRARDPRGRHRELHPKTATRHMGIRAPKRGREGGGGGALGTTSAQKRRRR